MWRVRIAFVALAGLVGGSMAGLTACDGLWELNNPLDYTCGDGERTGDEPCEGGDLGGKTCASQGFGGGSLRCTAQCTLDTSACTCVAGSKKCEGSSSLRVCNAKGAWETVACNSANCHAAKLGKSAGCGRSSKTSTDTCFCLGGRIGDSCDTHDDCTAANSGCGAYKWCNKSCNSHSDCGTNTSGRQNYCIKNVSGTSACYPRCTSNTDCKSFSGTTCGTPSGLSAKVCAKFTSS